MAQASPDASITTIERNPEMATLARENLAKYDLAQQIEVIEGDAIDVLTNLPGGYDFALWTRLSRNILFSYLRF